MKDVLFIVAIFAIWIGLNRWVLPWFGVPTCMSGCCGTAVGPQCNAPSSPHPSGNDATTERTEPQQKG
jgi:hypothetical protein